MSEYTDIIVPDSVLVQRQRTLNYTSLKKIKVILKDLNLNRKRRSLVRQILKIFVTMKKSTFEATEKTLGSIIAVIVSADEG